MQRISGALGTQSRVGPHNAPPAAIAVLDSNQTGVMGLRPNDNIASLSWGTDGTTSYDPLTEEFFEHPTVLVFSVDTNATGAADSDVKFESTLSTPQGTAQKPYPDNPGGGSSLTHGGEAAGDIFKSGRLLPFGDVFEGRTGFIDPAADGTNVRLVDEAALGLQAPRHNDGNVFDYEDDLNALEWENPLDRIDPDGDGQHSMPILFTLDRESPTVQDPLSSITADDVLVSLGPQHIRRFADGELDIGLLPGDAIDALAVSDILEPGALDYIGVDTALFSLAPGSPTLALYGLGPGDIFWTDFAFSMYNEWNPGLSYYDGGNLFATAVELGLLETDNLNALDVFYTAPIPEPSGLLLMAFVFSVASSVRSRRPRRRLLLRPGHRQIR